MTGKIGCWSSYAFILDKVGSYDQKKFKSQDLGGKKCQPIKPFTSF